ncbi:DUF1236 domain-containing protein [Aquamicrobium zhengzhouense]|uniref:DUF1236 domain-containing protein n=1 Tax=Aquamicrobium zhengzhouense TaxID=2781738 RepID=A0ABS0SAA3_9HYPH|nr:DUF1236 domain-containing protein [Aquamicrobium zhengzhouense]MBI1620182.1 DUF1236 domain-containing protein [Aquamicrobium zhengzhouense]
MKKIISVTVFVLGLTMPAFAQTTVTATTDLNVRTGPGPQYPVTGVIPSGESAQLHGCIEGSKWCSVATQAGDGWAYSEYLSGDFGGDVVILSERPAEAQIAVVPAPEAPSGGETGAVVGGVAGAVTGALIGGPVGAAIGGATGAVAGGTTGNLVDPPERVREYVTSNQIDPVYLEGEVVVGAGLPETVTLQEIPDYEYRYVYVNGQPVLVDSASRRIVYVVR